MPKNKSKAKKNIFSLSFKIGLVVLIVGALAFGRLSVRPQINMVVDQDGNPGTRQVPVSTCKPRPACLDQVPQCRVTDRPGAYCPAPTPSGPVGIQSFAASNPCGLSSYLDFRFTCKNGKSVSLTSKCLDIRDIITSAKTTCGEI